MSAPRTNWIHNMLSVKDAIWKKVPTNPYCAMKKNEVLKKYIEYSPIQAWFENSGSVKPEERIQIEQYNHTLKRILKKHKIKSEKFSKALKKLFFKNKTDLLHYPKEIVEFLEHNFRDESPIFRVLKQVNEGLSLPSSIDTDLNKFFTGENISELVSTQAFSELKIQDSIFSEIKRSTILSETKVCLSEEAPSTSLDEPPALTIHHPITSAAINLAAIENDETSLEEDAVSALIIHSDKKPTTYMRSEVKEASIRSAQTPIKDMNVIALTIHDDDEEATPLAEAETKLASDNPIESHVSTLTTDYQSNGKITTMGSVTTFSVFNSGATLKSKNPIECLAQNIKESMGCFYPLM